MSRRDQNTLFPALHRPRGRGSARGTRCLRHCGRQSRLSWRRQQWKNHRRLLTSTQISRHGEDLLHGTADGRHSGAKLRRRGVTPYPMSARPQRLKRKSDRTSKRSGGGGEGGSTEGISSLRASSTPGGRPRRRYPRFPLPWLTETAPPSPPRPLLPTRTSQVGEIRWRVFTSLYCVRRAPVGGLPEGIPCLSVWTGPARPGCGATVTAIGLPPGFSRGELMTWAMTWHLTCWQGFPPRSVGHYGHLIPFLGATCQSLSNNSTLVGPLGQASWLFLRTRTESRTSTFRAWGLSSIGGVCKGNAGSTPFGLPFSPEVAGYGTRDLPE